MNHNYIAFGLSQTNNMGSSSVIECVRGTQDNILGFTSWNEEGGRINNRNDVVSNSLKFCIVGLVRRKTSGTNCQIIICTILNSLTAKFCIRLQKHLKCLSCLNLNSAVGPRRFSFR